MVYDPLNNSEDDRYSDNRAENEHKGVEFDKSLGYDENFQRAVEDAIRQRRSAIRRIINE